MSITLEEAVAALKAMTPEEQAETIKLVMQETAHLPWVPNPGYQQMALDSEADELFFGGELGPGKTSLLIGAALTQHEQSIIFRREYSQIKGLEDEVAKILKTRDGYNASSHVWRIPSTNRVLEFGSVPHETDATRYQGRAHDLIAFDELGHFAYKTYRYLTLWLRTTTPGQRCRVISAGNKPERPEAFWVIRYWGAWLDPTTPDPAQPGELRWPVPIEQDGDRELFLRSKEEAVAHLATFPNPPRDVKTGEIIPPRSRTFVPGKLSENLDVASSYSSIVAHADKAHRGLVAGKFDESLDDDEWQLIPTRWIIEAQERRKLSPRPPVGVPMVAMGVDVGMGGSDETVIACRYDAWYDQLTVQPGAKTPNPMDVASLIFRHRRDGGHVIVDCGGGYGSGVVEHLEANEVPVTKYNGATAGHGRTQPGREHGFANKRAQSWYRFREALDPNQPGGSPIVLPDDPTLRADLVAPRYEITHRNEVRIEEKTEIKRRIGRSPDRGDAVVMAWDDGQRALKRGFVGPGASRRGSHRDRPVFCTMDDRVSARSWSRDRR